MVDPHKLLFGTPSTVSDREVFATARLNARVKAFAGRTLDDDVIGQSDHRSGSGKDLPHRACCNDAPHDARSDGPSWRGARPSRSYGVQG
jgi:hypothetical protein